jgi:hypothetical protein
MIIRLVFIFFILINSSSVAVAGEVSRVVPLSFGTIDLFPGGDIIVINASNGSASAVANRSLVTQARNGLLTLRSMEVEQVDIHYPTSVILVSSSGHQLVITEISTYSQYSDTLVDLQGNNIPVDVSVGGKLQLNGNEIHESYSGTLEIQLNFF